MWVEIWIFLISIFVIASILFKRKWFPDYPSDEAVHNQTNNIWYPLKYILAYALLSLRQRKLKKLKEPSLENIWSSINVTEDAIEKEKPQDLSQWSEKANDAIAFQGSDLDGNHLLIRIGRRANGRKEFWLCLRLKDEESGSYINLTHPEHPNTQVQCHPDSKDWSLEGLDCHVREPMRKWRISYNGWLRKGTRIRFDENRNQIDLVHVKFSFIWTAMSDVIDFNKDIHPSLVAQAMANESWSKDFFDNLQKMHEERYEQWGQMTGSISIEGGKDVNVILRGMRDHCYGERDWTKYDRYTANMGYCDDGTFFHVGAVSIPSGTRQLVYGYFGSFGSVTPVKYCSIVLPHLGANGATPNDFTIAFGTGTQDFLLRCTVRVQITVYNGSKWESQSNLRFLDIELNGKPATGFSEFEYRNQNGLPVPAAVLNLDKNSIFIQQSDLQTFSESTVIPLSHKDCTSEALVGGKGSQLAQLTQLQGSFSVPNGICLTTEAFQLFIESNPKLKESLQSLERSTLYDKLSPGVTKLNLKTTNYGGTVVHKSKLESINFEYIEHCFTSASIPNIIKDQLVAQLNRIFGKAWDEIPFAVRSSAIGEDGSDASSAGQLETFLEVHGIDKICESIVKCWASAFKEQAIKYRLQNGGDVFVRCGVVIQKLIPAYVSGVLFTCDPVTGHPGSVTINACYGLGEAVVSGVTEPDQIVTNVDYYTKKLTIAKKHIGSKTAKSTVDGGDTTNKCCLTDVQIRKICEIGLQLKSTYGSHRDIEWAIDGEVMGGVISPLGISIALTTVDKAIQYQMKLNGVAPGLHPDLLHVYTIHGGHVMLKLTETMYRDPNSAAARRVSELCVLGKILEDDNLDQILKDRLKHHTKLSRALIMGKVMKMIFTAGKLKNECLEKYDNYKFYLTETQEPNKLLSAIESCFQDYFKVWYAHIANSGYSGFWYHLIMGILVKDNTNWSPSILQDVAAIYATCTDVESADVPSALQKLASLIKNESDKAGIIVDSLSAKDALEWLNDPSSGKSGAEFRSFLNRHGHRCMHEIDLIEKSWAEEPESLIPVLQSMVSVNVENKRPLIKSDPKHVVNTLRTSLNSIEKKIIEAVIPKARSAVGNREQTKSLAIRVGHALRVGYRCLGNALVRRALLPEPELLYHLTHYEIKQLVACQVNRGRLIARAQRRRRIRPLQENIQLPEVAKGYPQPIGSTQILDTLLTKTISGTPVSAGHVQAPVKICKTLEDAINIERGDILIAHCTDIAWSIYFPLLGGVVTELGGLLSHGAVVAREYGLPCIVSANGATNVFKNGDLCFLDASKGSISLVEVDEK